MFYRGADGRKADVELHHNPEGDKRAAKRAVARAVARGMDQASAERLFGHHETPEPTRAA